MIRPVVADFENIVYLKRRIEELEAEVKKLKANQQHTCEWHQNMVKKGGPCVWCDLEKVVKALEASIYIRVTEMTEGGRLVKVYRCQECLRPEGQDHVSHCALGQALKTGKDAVSRPKKD